MSFTFASIKCQAKQFSNQGCFHYSPLRMLCSGHFSISLAARLRISRLSVLVEKEWLFLMYQWNLIKNMPLLNTNYMAFNKNIKWRVLVSLHFYLLLIVIDLFSRYVLFFPFQTMWWYAMQVHTRAYVCMIYVKQETNSLKNITWSEFGKQNIQAKGLFLFGILPVWA